MSVTILGSTGFIGSHLVSRLAESRVPYQALDKDFDLCSSHLGTVIYCIGLTADFRWRPLDTVEAHVCTLKDILDHASFDSLTYLSSTRIYAGAAGPAREDACIQVKPIELDHLYNISKLMGESLLLSSGRNVKIARLSNVYGNDFYSSNFLTSVLREATTTEHVTLRTSLESTKDYIHIDDVTNLLLRIAQTGTRKIYNVANGSNTSNRAIVEAVRSVTNCSVTVDPAARTVAFPEIDTSRIRKEFRYEPTEVVESVLRMAAAFGSESY